MTDVVEVGDPAERSRIAESVLRDLPEWFGLEAETARRLLIYAFAADVLEKIEQADVREALERMTLERFVKKEELVPV